MEIRQRFHYERDPELAEKVIEFIENSPDENLFRIHVYKLAKQWQKDKRELLELFIYGLHAGIFVMHWEFHCPFCGGVAKETLTVHEARSEDYCTNCQVHFYNKVDDNIEVFFSVHPEVRKLPLDFEAQHKASIMTTIAQHGAYQWKKEEPVLGVDLLQNPLYRELFGEEVLLPDQSLELMRATILFTDIKGSTQMYTELGDSKAFQLVREHFRLLFDVIKQYHGVPVKTIGDAVMGVFTDRCEAMKASLEAQRIFGDYYRQKPEKERIEIKIGLHSGNTIIVTLNGRLDYFGSNVNMAARVQAKAQPNEVVISEELFRDPEVRKIISHYTRTVVKEKTLFKGLPGEHTIYHVKAIS